MKSERRVEGKSDAKCCAFTQNTGRYLKSRVKVLTTRGPGVRTDGCNCIRVTEEEEEEDAIPAPPKDPWLT